MFFKELYKVYSQLQNNKGTTSDLPRAETELHRKDIWEKKASLSTNAQWLADLRADQSNFPKQEPVTITVTDIQH